MLRTVFTRCRPSPQIIAKRLRSTKSRPKHDSKQKWSAKRFIPSKHYNLPRPKDSPFLLPPPSLTKGAPPADLAVDKCHEYFQQELQNWSTNNRTLSRFARFGYDTDAIRPILAAYVSTAQSGFFSSPEKFAQYQLIRFTTSGVSYAGLEVATKPHLRLLDAETTFSNIFFSWVANEGDSGGILDQVVGEDKARRKTLDALRHLAIVSERRPAEQFTWARKIQREFIMHVGPTNSGKTHHALRALAAAKTGIYAGPLRLLAHEIWERLNLGQIVPLGVDVPPPSSATSPPPPNNEGVQINETAIAPRAKIHSTPAHARLTNMITGEERKIVDDDAPLLACTIEMISFRHQYDVGVIDEIQMVGDPQRGFAWTDAVLGLCAREIHLCGEESAIPVVQELLKETGDKLTVRRYERLSPLNVEDKSLDGDFSKVMKGDCIVAFSRTRIFEIKTEVEKKSGLRCAVVYGKLPPEIRSEQAALFNDPDSGFDVIIGSDAIGMGLNLKIRRIIFDQTSKPSGEDRTIALTISQMKQIAGRAGRYGQSLSGEKPGGFATTFYEKDLPVLRDALAQPATPTLTHAYIGPTLESFAAVASALPPRATTASSDETTTAPLKTVDLETAQMAHICTTLPPSVVYKHSQRARLSEICTWIDAQSKGEFTWDDKLQFLSSPISWRDEAAVEAAAEMAALQREEMCVVIGKIASIVGDVKKGKKGLVWALEEMESTMLEAERERERGREAIRVGVDGGAKMPLTELLTPLETEPQSSSLTDIPPLSSTPAPSSSPSPSISLSTSMLAPLFKPVIDGSLLEHLETLHKILVLYMWQHLRNSIVYSDRINAENLKYRVEVALDWGLREVGKDDGVGMKMRGRGRKHLVGAEENGDDDLGVYGWSASKAKKMESKKGKVNPKEKNVRGRDRDEKRRKGSDRSTSRGGRTREDYEGGFRSFEAYNSRGSLLSLPSSPPLLSPSPSSQLRSSLYEKYSFDKSSRSLSPPLPSSGHYYPPAAGPSLSTRASGITSAIANARAKNGVGSNVGGGSSGVNSNVSPTGWTRAPDLTALLKMYVDNPSLRAERSGGVGARK